MPSTSEPGARPRSPDQPPRSDFWNIWRRTLPTLLRTPFVRALCTGNRAVYDGGRMQGWDGVRLGLLALGYSKVVWIHLHCVRHGLFRVGIAEEQECYPCPTCERRRTQARRDIRRRFPGRPIVRQGLGAE